MAQRRRLDPPTAAVVVERLRTEATTWVNGTALQAGRIARRHRKPHMEPAECEALEVDLHLFLVAVVRLRRCVERVRMHVTDLTAVLDEHLRTFDQAVPSLVKLRNVSEHVDEYNLDEGRDRSVSRWQVQSWYMDQSDNGGLIWGWLGERFDVQIADQAATDLHRAFTAECDAWIQQSRSESSAASDGETVA